MMGFMFFNCSLVVYLLFASQCVKRCENWGQFILVFIKLLVFLYVDMAISICLVNG